MLGWLSQSRDRSAARSLYDATLAAAREPALYASYAAPDTIEGRFEMLALHLAVLLDRLGKADAPARRLLQPLTEQFVVDMDDAMRAFGIGDLAVPRKVKKAAAALYDRHKAYGAAIAADDPHTAWATALGAQLDDLAGKERIDIAALATYAATLAPHLAPLSNADLAAGRVTFPSAPAS
jgi:cytochrome b pre-mRNA-processing protein 3